MTALEGPEEFKHFKAAIKAAYQADLGIEYEAVVLRQGPLKALRPEVECIGKT